MTTNARTATGTAELWRPGRSASGVAKELSGEGGRTGGLAAVHAGAGQPLFPYRPPLAPAAPTSSCGQFSFADQMIANQGTHWRMLTLPSSVSHQYRNELHLNICDIPAKPPRYHKFYEQPNYWYFPIKKQGPFLNFLGKLCLLRSSARMSLHSRCPDW